MMKKRDLKGLLTTVSSVAFGLILGGVCGWLIITYMDTTDRAQTSIGQDLFDFAVLIVGMYIAFFAQTMLHELGHLVFGLASGYRFSSFRIGSFMWMKEDGKLRLRRMSLAGTGGQCLMVPPELVDGKVPVVLYNLGGSLMNVAASALLLGLYFLVGGTVGMLALMSAVIGFAFALMNGVPVRLGIIDNDGYNALSLHKDPKAIESFWLQMKINEQITKGIRLKDMPEEWFSVPDEAAMKNSIVAVMGVFACNRLMDEKKIREADELLRHLLSLESGIVGIHRNLMLCDRIYCALVLDADAERACVMLTPELQRFMRSMKKFPAVLRTQYTYALLCQGDEAAAQKYLDRFQKIGKHYPYPGDVVSEGELMTLAREKYAS